MDVAIAAQLPGSWTSTRLGQVGPARIKVLRMDEQTYEEETHDYNEGLLVISGCLHLRIGDQAVRVDAGQMYLWKPAPPTVCSPAARAPW